MKKSTVLYAFSLVLICIVSVAFAYSHTWGEWTISIKPTCLTQGEQTRRCTDDGCGSHQRRAINVLPHAYSVATCSKPSTCLNGCNQTKGTTIPHSFAPATCVSKATCTECGAEEGSLGNHTFSSASCLEPATCTICGATSGGLDSHRYSSATCLAPATCSVCGQTTGGLGNHNYIYGNCLVNSICKVCGDQQPGQHQWVVEGVEGEVKRCLLCGVSGICRIGDDTPVLE